MAPRPSRFSLSLRELKRRGVTRVATIYAVVGLGFIEASDIICGRFVMPDGTMRVLIIVTLAGFPIAIALSWIYDIVDRSIVKTEPLTPSEKVALPFNWKPRWLTIILLVVLLLISTAFFTVPRPNALGFKQQDWILIANLVNNTEDELFNRALQHALTVTIDQSKRINVYPQNQVEEVLKRMKKDVGEKITLPIAFEIAQREGIKVVLLLTISELGGIYVLSTSLLNPITGEATRSRQVNAIGKEEILPTMDKLAALVQKDLGESIKNVHTKMVPLPKATTHSLEALKCLTNANNITDNSNYKQKIELLQEAIELDPEFALAHSNLAAYYYWTNEREKGEEHIAIALGLMNRLTEKERLWIQAAVEGYRGNRNESIRRWEFYLSHYPDSNEGWYRLGYNYMMMDRNEESIFAFQRALEIYNDDNPSILVNIATCYKQMKEYDMAMEYYLETSRVASEFLKTPSLNHEFGFTYVEMGKLDEARKVYENQLSGNDEQKAMGLRSLALLSMYQGKYSEALIQIQKSNIINKSLGYGLSEYRNRLYLCNIYKVKGMMEEYRAELDHCAKQVIEVASEPWWYLLLGKMLIRMGDTVNAGLLLEEIVNRTNKGNRLDEACYHLLKGEMALNNRDFKQALEHLETANALEESEYYLESLAYYFAQCEDWEKAILLYEKIINENASLGWEGQECWVQAHLQLGKACEKAENKTKAIKSYHKLLDLWKEADPDLPDLLDVKLRLNLLLTL